MIRQVRLSAIERKAKSLLEKDGYAVSPMRHCFITRYKPVNLMARRNRRELLYLRLRETTRPLSAPADVGDFCRDDLLLFRRLFPVRPVYVTLRFAIWILQKGSGFCCYEICGEEISASCTVGNKSGGTGNRIFLPASSPALVTNFEKETLEQPAVQLQKPEDCPARSIVGSTGGLQP